MNNKEFQKKILRILCLVVVVLLAIAVELSKGNRQPVPQPEPTRTDAAKNYKLKHNHKKSDENTIDSDEEKVTAKEINNKEKDKVHPWNKPSESSYPIIKYPEELSVEVSIANQRVYIKEKGETIYTMICSTGDSKAGTPTPTGEFVIEPERGDKFYWEDDDDWAYNWVSFSGNGVYLFHSVLMWNEEQVEEKEAIRLGQEASHGCIRLPLPDSKWFYDNIPTGTPVSIQ